MFRLFAIFEDHEEAELKAIKEKTGLGWREFVLLTAREYKKQQQERKE